MAVQSFLSRLRSSMEGNVLALTAFGLTTLVGGAALAVDTAQWYLWKRQLQQAVDAGARAGVLSQQEGSDYASAATQEVGRNGVSTSAVTIELLSNPPTSGAYTGDSNAVEVQAITSQKLPFSSMFLNVAPTVRARAVATVASDGEYCVIALSPSGVGIGTVGSAHVDLGCGAAANSNIETAIDLDGSSWLDAPNFHAVGGIQASSSNIPSNAALQPYGLPIVDPIASRNLTVPTSPTSCTANNLNIAPSVTTTIYPGRYCNGVTLQGDITLSPGVYIIDKGSFTVNSQAHLTGEGVTIILTGDDPKNVATVKLAGGADVDLRAPTAVEDPTWKNVLFFQDPMGSSSDSNITGGSTLKLDGIVYMPGGNLSFTGNAGQHADCLLMVANQVTFAGTTSLDNNCSADYNDLDLSARVVRVVE
ncbi:TadE/TadG family type IV pilus assembly protein [Novosphingobium mangrovi (ex Huang et al. 2023)]|uniref:Pilus assembly protein n=1 Tax=Novosphingobium mangrovi (ex Huang et al. 2023) TaxID=2976432 RepID=A0ABT2I0B1_9SPHN|nr:TadE/TadG family type IV pilus assembly protein [Novosphingobium mangrovi (ex Huang et al. 2023)]MCT2398235.1 pilus assembly protein [Novosphingobium mangrovi (ex Huang et al. 2023)]